MDRMNEIIELLNKYSYEYYTFYGKINSSNEKSI